ncbi:MAG TPA: hypothetical protein P5569_02305, partial [Candidatus Latescibacteria bacterium]|nr:hypothetical protein [Candidatus Latescibacterota bacterium]
LEGPALSGPAPCEEVGRWEIQPSQNTHEEKRRHSRGSGNPEHPVEEILRTVRAADAAQNDG